MNGNSNGLFTTNQTFLLEHAEATTMEQESAIFKLDEDALRNIFRMNADMDQDRCLTSQKTDPDYSARVLHALTVTRRSSQVCRLWRGILLECPSMWAQLIDWAVFGDLETDAWLEEILRRSGKAPLHIKSEQWIEDGPKLQTFVSLIDTHWYHIRDLEFGLWHITTPGVFTTIYQTLCRPAECLQSLSIHLEGGEGRFSVADAPLFSNQAPSLRNISLHWVDFTFNPRAAMFSNLRALDIAHATYLKFPDVLEALSNTPLLELLGIRECHLIRYEKFDDRRAEIHLPKLRYMRVVDPQFAACASIVDTIVPGEGCIVNWWCLFTQELGIQDPLYSETSQDLISRNLETLCSSFQWIAEEYTDWHSVNVISVTLCRGEFAFADISELPLEKTQSYSWNHLFLDVLKYLSQESLCMLFKSVSTACLGDVKRMKLCFEPRGLDFDDFDFAGFFKGLPLLEHLVFSVYDTEVLQFFLSGAGKQDQDIFPNLKHLTYLLWESHDSEPLLAFLRWRRTMGVLIETLDLCLRMRTPDDLSCLEEMVGLKVIRRIITEEGGQKEYLCGSSDPNMLIVGRQLE